jgi:hypothetical protein
MGELQFLGVPAMPIPPRGLPPKTEDGVYLSDLPLGAHLELETLHHTYQLVNAGAGKALLSGHPDYCPGPVEVLIKGSNWGGSLMKRGFIGCGMHLEFLHPTHGAVVTSRVRSIRRIS